MHVIIAWILKFQPTHPLVENDKKNGHGEAWKTLMRRFGHEPRRCATEEECKAIERTPRINPYIYRYTCSSGCSMMFSQKRHNNVTIRGGKYRCVKHGSYLTYQPPGSMK